jgi:hypothetical protein
MAEVIKRTSRSGPRGVRKTSWGYTLQINGKQERKINAAWSEDDAEKALAARILERDVASPSSRPTLNLREAVDRYFVAQGEQALARGGSSASASAPRRLRRRHAAGRDLCRAHRRL